MRKAFGNFLIVVEEISLQNVLTKVSYRYENCGFVVVVGGGGVGGGGYQI